jgi:phosphopentomutase
MTKHTHAHKPPFKRVIVIVLDGAGVGELPDAGKYGDCGANTLKSVLKKHGPLQIKNLNSLGLSRIVGITEANGAEACAARYYGRMSPKSPGKDTTSGHWELAGLIIDKPFPAYPSGFPPQIIKAFETAIGRQSLGNVAASGTEIIKDLGPEHLKTGFPIVYTSADSVFQIAAHEEVVPNELLYEWCKKARKILTGEHAVGRVIARPFKGAAGAFVRTAGRHDYSLEPPGKTLLDLVSDAGYPVAVIGKVSDIFAHRGITEHRPAANNDETAEQLLSLATDIPSGLLWATFSDFDTIYGHRNDSDGFAQALERFDLKLEQILAVLGEQDLLFITADHGCDPTFPTTDHTREYVPIIAWGRSLPFGIDLGTRNSYADLSASAAFWLELEPPQNGSAFISL